MKNKLPLSFLLLFLFSSNFLFAQNGNIKGIIKTSDGEPAQYVTVAIKGTTKGTVANQEGKFELKNVAEGNQILVISFVGLETKEISTVVKANETIEVGEIILKENAQTLKEVVVSANSGKFNFTDPSNSLRLKTPILETPQNIQIISSDLMRDQQMANITDGLVKNVAGVVRSEHWADLYANISTRGAQIQAFRNGFNIVNSYWGPLAEDMSFVDRIEFVKGPAGFMLASGDPSGLFNIETKKPTGQTKGEATMMLGSFDFYRASVDLDGKLSKDGRLLYRLNVASQNKKSFRLNEYNDRYVIAPVISYQLDEKTKLTAEYIYQKAFMSNLGSAYLFSPDGFETLPLDFSWMPSGLEGMNITDKSFLFNMVHDFNANWKLTGQVSRYTYDQTGTAMWPVNTDSTGKFIRQVWLWDSYSEMTMGQVFLNGEFKTGSIRHRILVGIDLSNKNYLADWNQVHDLDSVGAEFDIYNPNLGMPVNGYPMFDRSKTLEERAYAAGSYQDQRYSAYYLQDELSFLNNHVRLTLAGRYTFLTQAYYGADTANHFTPRAGLSVSIDESTTAYAMYDQAFIPQTGRFASGQVAGPITGNNMEIGFKRNWFNNRLITSLSIYRILKNNELAADPNYPIASGFSIVMGQKTSQGIEFDLKGNICKGLNLILNYAYTDSKVTQVTEGITHIEVGDVVPGFAKHTVNGWLSYEIKKGKLTGSGLTFGANVLLDRATYWEPAPDATKEVQDYFKLEAGLFYENGKIRISGNIYNLLDDYLYSGSYDSWLTTYTWQTEAPRNFRLSVSYKF